MAALFQHRLSVLSCALILLLLAPGVAVAAMESRAAGGSEGTTFLDAVLGAVDGATLTASDIGLARALRLFGLRPSGAPIRAAEVTRFIDVRLVLEEADRLGIEAPATDLEVAWREAAARLGGPGALEAWLRRAGVEEAWARRLVAEDLRWRRFIDLRFRAFVFIPENDVTQALGPGPHTVQERERTRLALIAASVKRELERWLVGARARARIELVPTGLPEVPSPFAMPPGVPGSPAVRDPGEGRR